MKSIVLSQHAKEQCLERGTNEKEIKTAILKGVKESAKHGREMSKYNFAFNKNWRGEHYAIKQVVPVFKEEKNEIVVITVYTFYF